MKTDTHKSNLHPLSFVIDVLAELGRTVQEIKEKPPAEADKGLKKKPNPPDMDSAMQQ